MVLGTTVALALLSSAAGAAEPPAGDPARGARVFGVCAACHSLEPGRHLSGPSLASIWKRKAASVDGFLRYSEALERSGLVWDEATLDRWLAEPRKLVPGTEMVFAGLPDPGPRRDLIAFLRAVSEGQAPPVERGGMMGARPMRNLKETAPHERVTAITHCKDTYRVTTEAGTTRAFWEFNLRFKTDSSPAGPPKGRPVLLPASMQGDRAFLIFADPEEIGRTIRKSC